MWRLLCDKRNELVVYAWRVNRLFDGLIKEQRSYYCLCHRRNDSETLFLWIKMGDNALLLIIKNVLFVKNKW